MLALAALAWLCARPARALLPSELNTIAVAREASPSVVFVTNIALVQNFFLDEYAVPQGAGSGIVWDKEGHILTNYHVVEGGSAFLVTFKDHTQLDARVIGVEPRKDIAVLQVDARKEKLAPISLGRSSDLQVGQKTVAIGNPFGLDDTVTQGIVSALNRQIEGVGGVTIHGMIQTDAAINPGNSGGPLLDSDGRLIGMNTLIYSDSGNNSGVGFAVPVDVIKRIVPEIIRYGHSIEPGLGVNILSDLQAYDLLGSQAGVVVASVRPGTPAARAGLRGISRDPDTGRLVLGDIIEGINSTPITDYDDLYNALDALKKGDVVTVKTLRGGRKRSYRVRLINVD
ncbi:MAG: trypsin-like peptidase domain-containing protein [Elusimicrobia bacterium]|nr:trypsin-like peptidase domain-containing protein [Elusimicrobiota bacterium]